MHEVANSTRSRARGDLPDRLPAFGNVVVSGVGDVWVSLTEYDLSQGLDWLVFSGSGELRGAVHTPAQVADSPDLKEIVVER